MLQFHQVTWDDHVADDCRNLVRLAVREDLDRYHDWTTLALVDPTASGKASLVARQPGIVAGLPAAEVVLSEMNLDVQWTALGQDGRLVGPAARIAEIAGLARQLLTAERLVLNLISRLSGIATKTAEFVKAIDGCQAKIYDTRKTTPGFRRLEKYAVRCGGGCNHRTGLYDAVLIKDNHLAVGSWSPADAVARCREFLKDQSALTTHPDPLIVEVEVDTLAQLKQTLTSNPDIILLDNMSTQQLREAVQLRDAAAPEIQLEASGSIRLANVREIAETGVDRISVGALTHSATWLDIGLDWMF